MHSRPNPIRLRSLLAAGAFCTLTTLQTGPAAAQDTEERRVLAVAEAALVAITNEDMVAFTDLMVEEAVTFAVAEAGAAEGRYSVTQWSEWRARTMNVDVVERGFDGEVRISGPLATVWLPYDLYVNGEWSHCGVDTFTLARLNGQWRIAGLSYTVEQPPACRRHPDGPPGN